MTCIEKLRELHPEWDEDVISENVKLYCPDNFDCNDRPDWCPIVTYQPMTKENCQKCWEREYVEPIPHEFEYLSKAMIYDKDGERKMRNERVWVTVLDRMYKHHYTGKPYFRIRTESQSGGVWEGWVTEEDIREMLEEKV
jgi:hypothetical protein